VLAARAYVRATVARKVSTAECEDNVKKPFHSAVLLVEASASAEAGKVNWKRSSGTDVPRAAPAAVARVGAAFRACVVRQIVVSNNDKRKRGMAMAASGGCAGRASKARCSGVCGVGWNTNDSRNEVTTWFAGRAS